MINKIPSVTFIYNRYKKATPTTKASVEIRITYDKKQKYISTGVMLYPHQWRNGAIINCPDALEISKALDKTINNVRKAIFKMMEEGCIDIYAIPKKMEELDNPKMNFWNFCQKRMEVRIYSKSTGTKLRYERFIRFFREWGGIQDFNDITEANIIAYDKFLIKKKLKNSTKWNNYHRFLNSFILDAIQEGYLRRNPYHSLNIDKEKTDSLENCLTPAEFYKLKAIHLPTASLQKVRDIFVFQTYTCLSYTDLVDFNASNIREIKGTKVYMGNRNKTGTPFTTPLLAPAIAILEKYHNTLPVISNVKYNYYLKVVAQAAGIDKPISTHWARHTGATLLLNEGVPMQIVSKICGHSSIRITEKIYAKLLDETVVDAVTSISWKKT